MEFFKKNGLTVMVAIALVIIIAFFLTSQNVDLILNGAYFLLILGLILAIVLPIVSAIKNPKSILKAGIGIGLILVIYLISRSMSSDLVLNSKSTGFEAIEGAKFSGAILTTTYVLLIIAIAAVIITPIVNKVIKND